MGLCRSINADSSERLSRLWILLQFSDMTLSLFAICLRFPGFCLGDEVALGAGRNCCGELMLGSEYVLVDDPEVESMSNLFVELCRFRVELIVAPRGGCREHRTNEKSRLPAPLLHALSRLRDASTPVDGLVKANVPWKRTNPLVYLPGSRCDDVQVGGDAPTRTCWLWRAQWRHVRLRRK